MSCAPGKPSTQPKCNRKKAEAQQREQDPIATAGIERWRNCVRGQREIGVTDGIQVDLRDDPARLVNDPTNAVVGNPYQRQPFFHRAGAGDRKMLIGTGGASVPGVVRDIQYPRRAVVFVDDGARKYDLIADQRSEGGEPGSSIVLGPGPAV